MSRAATAENVRTPMRSKVKQLKPALRYDPILLAVVLLLTMFGVVMVYSASAVFASEKLHDGLWFFKRQAVGAALGLAAMLGAMKFGWKRLEALAVPLLLL
ncbi:MAG: FtsW/RodA/SpoVE family cell cycle protein [Deltaproteobacteria bacterium]|nr:FtsW/RodA/SpoVE family cell cycle protein [Deltaproteobacteria bacterium]